MLTRPLRCLLLFTFVAFLTAALNGAVTTDEKVPIDIEVFIPCAAGGAGELVQLQGNLHVLMRYTETASGTVHAAAHFQPQGVSGTGLTTGEKYQGTGVTQEEFNAKLGVEETLTDSFRIIGQGSGNNFLLHETFHLTVHANGGVSAFFDRFSVDCR